MLRKNTKITLISVVETQDADGFVTVTETPTDVYAAVESITGTEFYQTGLLNIRADFRATIYRAEYAGERLVEKDGKRYGVYRTYVRTPDEIELYCEEKAGVNPVTEGDNNELLSEVEERS